MPDWSLLCHVHVPLTSGPLCHHMLGTYYVMYCITVTLHVYCFTDTLGHYTVIHECETPLLRARVSSLHGYCSSLDMILHLPLLGYTDILHGLLLHIYVSLVHGLSHVILLVVIIVTWILGISLLHMHVWFLYSCHMDPRSYYMYYCAMISSSCYMIVSYYWYGYSRYWTWELLICDMWNSTFIVPVSRYIVPVSRYIVLCYQQSSCPVIMLHISCTIFVLVTLCTWHIRS